MTTLEEILVEIGVPFVEDDIQTYDIVNSDEAWLPSTPYCLSPVVRINGVEIGTGKPGPMGRKMLQYWSEKVARIFMRKWSMHGRCHNGNDNPLYLFSSTWPIRGRLAPCPTRFDAKSGFIGFRNFFTQSVLTWPSWVLIWG